LSRLAAVETGVVNLQFFGEVNRLTVDVIGERAAITTGIRLYLGKILPPILEHQLLDA
jgi:hypothetical protein